MPITAAFKFPCAQNVTKSQFIILETNPPCRAYSDIRSAISICNDGKGRVCLADISRIEISDFTIRGLAGQDQLRQLWRCWPVRERLLGDPGLAAAGKQTVLSFTKITKKLLGKKEFSFLQ